MAMTAPTGRPNLEGEGGQQPLEPRRQTEMDVDSRDSNDSGNELSMGGSSSEGDSMSHHHSQHSPNQQDSLLASGPPNFHSLTAVDHLSPFKVVPGSLFDTPPSMVQSPHQRQLHPFSQAAFGLGLPQDSFQCAMCAKTSRNGILQFVCAHKTCQSCCQLAPTRFDQRIACNVCGAGPATSANFPPQMFLSPTLTTPPMGLLLDTSNNSMNSAPPSQPTRAFSFSLSGLPGSPSPMAPRMSTPTGGMRPFHQLGLSDMDIAGAWSPLQPPPPLRNLANRSPMMSKGFDSLTVNDETPVFSPLSPTNTSSHMPPSLIANVDTPKHSAAIAPPRTSICSTPRLPMPSASAIVNSPVVALQQQHQQQQFVVPPQTAQQMPTIACQGCDSAVSLGFCMQCQEALCSHCIQAHQRVRATKAHAFVELNQLMATLAQQAQFMQNGAARQTLGSSGSGDGHGSGLENDSISENSSPRSSSVCGSHESPIIGICENCPQTSPMCAICIAQHQRQHRVQPVGDIRMAVEQLTNECQLLQWQCDKTNDTIKKVIEGVSCNSSFAEKEIRNIFDAHITALEERREELLKRVENVKNWKISVLVSQGENLQSRQSDLKSVIQKAQMTLQNNDIDELELRQVFEKLTLCQMSGSESEFNGKNNNVQNLLQLACQVNEDDRLKFTAPQDGVVLNKIRQFGNIESGACAKTSTIVGESYKKAIRERQTVVFVQLRDACGDLLSSSISATQSTNQALLPHQVPHSHFEQAMPTADLQAIVISPDGSSIEVGMTPRENGVVALSYFPSIEGSYTLNILVKGTPINGCPATMEVKRGRNYDEIATKGPVLTFGKEGSGDGELCRPWGICVDKKGRVLVADRSNNRIQIFDKDGNFLAKFGTSGNRPGQFDRPAGITTNTLNNIVVADKDNHRIQVFDEDGGFLLKFGDRGRAVGYFNYPWGVATNSHNAIAVSDTRNHRVQIFTPQGQFVRKCGFDSAYFFKNLDSPRGLCYLPDGQLLITDFNNHRLAVLSPRNMAEMKVYGSEGDADGMFVRPQGVVVDPEGHILVCDSRNNRIQVFSSDDMRFIGSFGLGPVSTGFQMPAELPAPYSSLAGPFGAPSFSSTPTPLTPSPRQLLDRPTDLAVGPDGRIYVVDFGNNCIRVF